MGRSVKLVFYRLLQSFGSLLILIFICFWLLRFFPGSPLNQVETLNPQIIEQLRSSYRLDESLWTQFSTYVGHVLTGELGWSMHFIGRSVQSLIWEFGQTTFFLGSVAFVCALAFAFLYSILTRFWKLETKTDFILLLGLSVPSFALGPLLIWFFGFHLSLLPVALLEKASSYLLPIFLLSFKPALTLARVLSSSLDLTLRERYIQTARALGFSDWSIITKWALKNSWIPVLAQSGHLFAGLISGSFLVEVLFSIPGLGSQFVGSVLDRDWPLILGLSLFYGALLICCQLMTDLLSSRIDQRVNAL
jgi:ABC-type dipeptide/oligopeptide/nickel transport system permease component